MITASNVPERQSDERKKISMTKAILERLEKDNKNVYEHIEELKKNYSNCANRELARGKIGEYLTALEHVALITNMERRFLYCYITI